MKPNLNGCQSNKGQSQVSNLKQPSFTVKNTRLQLVKIDHVISVYLSVTGTAVQKNIIYLWLSLQKIQTTTYISQNNFN